MATIAVDAMGGDHAPRAEVEGAIAAARELGIGVLLVGQQGAVKAELARHGGHRGLPIGVEHASEVITMGDSPTRAFRRKRDSSVHVAARLVRKGRADGMVSAGNTGAVMATSRFVLGTLPSVDRPALAAVFPTARGTPTVLLDVGANVDSKPEHLEQFAVMGEIFYRTIFGVRRPRVGLLSIGEEETKGNEVTRQAYELLKHSGLHFKGNVEGRDVFSGNIEVVVCDGFIGNVALKISEGVAEHLMMLLKLSLKKTLAAQVGYMFSRQALQDFKKQIDYAEYGGAPLLGVRGIVLIGHGRSNANAIKNAIRVAAELARARLGERIEHELAAVGAVSKAERSR